MKTEILFTILSVIINVEKLKVVCQWWKCNYKIYDSLFNFFYIISLSTVNVNCEFRLSDIKN